MIQRKLILYDLCQTVYPSPQICIPAGDVDACLSMESSLLRLCIFQTALKNTFLWYYFFTLERAGKDMVSLGGSERIAEEYLIKIFEALFLCNHDIIVSFFLSKKRK